MGKGQSGGGEEDQVDWKVETGEDQTHRGAEKWEDGPTRGEGPNGQMDAVD